MPVPPFLFRTSVRGLLRSHGRTRKYDAGADRGEERTPEKLTIHNTSRAVEHRTHRARAAVHARKKHYLGGGAVRVLPARPLIIGRDMVLRHLEELKKKQKDRMLEVRTLDGRLFDLTTFEIGSAAPIPPLPHPPLDSVANDSPHVGIVIPPYVGDDTGMPHVLAPGEKPSLLKDVELSDQVDQETAAASSGDTEVVPPASDEAVTDAELEAALEAAQEGENAPSVTAVAVEPATAETATEVAEEGAAPTEPEVVSSGESKSTSRNQRRKQK
jgi:hypothetical protein